MKKLIAILSGLFVLLLSFQNCQKPPHPDEINGNVSQSSTALNSVGTVDLSQESVDTVQFLVSDSRVVSKAGNNYQVNYNKILEVDLQSGVLTETSDLDSASASYCLPESVKEELLSIIKSSQVCQVRQEAAAGEVCTQSITQAYASVVTSNSQFDLGYSSSPCSGVRTDLCGEQSDVLKGFIASLKSQYHNYTCQ